MFRKPLPIVVVASSVCVSALAIKFPGADGYLAHTRAPDSRTDVSPSFVCFASLCFFSEEKD